MTASSFLFSSKVSDHSPMVVGGKGNVLTVEDPETHKRRQVFDAMGGAAVSALGYGDEEIIEEIAKAAKECSYSYLGYMTNYWAEELAKFYIEKSPKDAFAAALFTCSGSESNENGMKTVRQYWLERGQPERTVFISRKQSYHGFTIGALSLSESNRKDSFRAITLPAKQVPKVSCVYPYREMKEGETLDTYCQRLLQELEDKILEVGPEKVGAFLCETLSGSTYGTSPSIPGYLQGVRKICDKYEILFWLDEVMCGTGRASATGGLNCWESWPDFKGPDLQLVGKTLGSGYVSVAGLLVSPKVRNAFVAGSNYIPGGQTYHQHAFNCRVALAVQKKIDRLGLRKNVFENGNRMGERLKELAKSTEIVGDVRGLGGFWSLELVKNKTTKEPFPAHLTVGVKTTAKLFANGMTSMGLGGTAGNGLGDHITVAPSYIITEKDANYIAEMLIKAVKEIEDDLRAVGEL